MQDNSSDVFVSGKILFHADDFSDVHRGKQKTIKTNKQTSEPKNSFPFNSLRYDSLFN